jgi:capsular exopolysaccharide synthesis family protein
MSEIFDFLRKTEAERRKSAVAVPEMIHGAPLPDPVEDLLPENAPEPVPEKFTNVESEICPADQFDLTGANKQIKHVLDPLTLVGEQFRLLRSRLGLMQKQQGIKTVLITSSVPDEGKTFMASGLAGVFAQEPGKRVLLIDADMRKPKSGAAFGVDGNARLGLSNVLRGELPFQKALLQATNPEFCLLPSGALPSNPSELLSSRQFEEMLRTAAENFDWVILDSPPVVSLSDTTLLAPLCDAIVLVVRANSTPSKLVLNAINRIGRDRICGVVVNRQKHVHHSRYYYQYYYSSPKKK